MSKKKRKGPGSGPIIMLLAIGALGLGALATYVKTTPADKVPPEFRRSEPSHATILDRRGERDTSESVSRHAPSQKVLVPVIRSGERVKLVSAETQRGDPMVYAVDRTLEEFKLKGAKVEHINVAGGVAKIDFNPAVTDGMGSIEGSTFLKAVQMVMGQFKDVELLQFSVDGQPIDSLDGHIEVTDPVPVIRPGARPNEGPDQP